MATTIIIGNNTGDDFSGTAMVQIAEGAPTTNYVATTNPEVTKYAAGLWTQTLLRFDIAAASIPSDKVIDSVILRLYHGGASAGAARTIAVKRSLRAWVDSQATWNVYTTGNSWTTAGALSDGNDRAAGNLATRSIDDTNLFTRKEWTGTGLTSFVQGVVDGSFTNNGFVLERTDGADDSHYDRFLTQGGGNNERPQLEITYSDPPTTTTGRGLLLGVG